MKNNYLIILLILQLFNKCFLLSLNPHIPSKEYLNLVSWIESNGGYVHPSLIPNELSSTNRFIQTKTSLHQLEDLLFIPDKILLYKNKEDLYKKCCQVYMYEDDWEYDCLVYFITIDKYDKKSKYLPYYNYLPIIDTEKMLHPIPESEYDKYRETGIIDRLESNKNFLNKALNPAIPYLKKFAIKHKLNYEDLIEEFIASFFLVGTRDFSRLGSTYEISTLVPYLDLLNHSNKYNTWWFYSEKRGGYVLFAVRDIKPWEEITDFYGKHSNTGLFTQYGFIIPGNIYGEGIYIKLFGGMQRFTKDRIARDFEYFKKDYYKVKGIKFKEVLIEVLNKLNEKKEYYLTLHPEKYEVKVIIEEHKELIDYIIKYINTMYYSEIRSINKF